MMKGFAIVASVACLATAAHAGSFLATYDGASWTNNGRISAMGHSLTEDWASNFASRGDLASFDAIWLNPSMDGYYGTVQSLVAGGGALESYVAGGGTLVVHAAGNSGTISDIAPGGVDFNQSYSEMASIVAPSHPYITGAGTTSVSLSDSDFDFWGTSVHGTLSGFPGSFTEIIRSDGDSQPAMAEYNYGAGRVIVTGLTFGWGSSPTQTIDNLIAYAATDIPAPSSLALLGLGGLAAARRRRA